MRRDDFARDLLIMVVAHDGNEEGAGDGGRKRRADAETAEESAPARLPGFAQARCARRRRWQRCFDAAAQMRGRSLFQARRAIASRIAPKASSFPVQAGQTAR